MGNDKNEPIDPRSLMTDRTKHMTRSLHTPRIVVIVALDIAKREGITAPTEAVRRACRFLEIPDNYDPEIDPTFKSCVKQVKAALTK